MTLINKRLLLLVIFASITSTNVTAEEDQVVLDLAAGLHDIAVNQDAVGLLPGEVEDIGFALDPAGIDPSEVEDIGIAPRVLRLVPSEVEDIGIARRVLGLAPIDGSITVEDLVIDERE